jgi:hypothetical protein
VNGVLGQIVAGLITIASGTGFWGFVQWARERKGAKARAAKEQQAEENAAKQAEVDKATLLADAQRVAQTTALNSADVAFRQVSKRCDECLEELHGLRDITGRLVDAVEALMQADTPESRAQARAAIRLARNAM